MRLGYVSFRAFCFSFSKHGAEFGQRALDEMVDVAPAHSGKTGNLGDFPIFPEAQMENDSLQGAKFFERGV